MGDVKLANTRKIASVTGPKVQTAEYASFPQDLGCREGTNLRCRWAKQLPSADQE